MADDQTAQEIAEACAASMWERDGVCRDFGLSLDRVAPGEAVLSMTVTDRMTNGHGIAHGGLVFTLADAAFGYASNTRDQRTVAQHCAITFIQAASVGDRLTATALERSLAGRSGIYDVTVTDQTGRTVAEFRGHSRTVAGAILPGADSGQGAR
ncbi:MAG: hydroxyphenylacetyl-CoA thioesterase PaaI [Alphaproteobacteria bacterium]|nr:hydroxyphenylacetyl-CoA thioesterase PaaI [Alphaproteobacteria bacterium]